MGEKKDGETRLEGETICNNDKKTKRKTTTNAKTKKKRSNIERECAGLKKWSSSQTREFGDLHALIATLVLACDTRWVPADYKRGATKINEALLDDEQAWTPNFYLKSFDMDSK